MKKSDTTVKLDGSLVEEVSKELEEGETLTAYVRKAVRYRVHRSRTIKAAKLYTAALASDPGLDEELQDWEMANLSQPPIRKQKESSK